MRRRPNLDIELAGVNATKTFFESCHHIFQEVNLNHDYGKDSYIDLCENDNVTGCCIALQIKSGKKYKRKNKYIIPIENHREVWQDSTLPIAGIVFDMDKKKLFWCDIKKFLFENKDSENIVIDATQELNEKTLVDDFVTHFQMESNVRTASLLLLKLCDRNDKHKIETLIDCFAIGRSFPSVFIVIRYLVNVFDDETLLIALHLLSHFVPHPDIFRTPENSIPNETSEIVRQHFIWQTHEIIALINIIDEDDLCRGSIGESLIMLFLVDCDIVLKMKKVVREAMSFDNKKVANIALALTIYYSNEKGDGKAVFESLINDDQSIMMLPFAPSILKSLDQNGFYDFF